MTKGLVDWMVGSKRPDGRNAIDGNGLTHLCTAPQLEDMVNEAPAKIEIYNSNDISVTA